jgi:sphingosine kinase
MRYLVYVNPSSGKGRAAQIFNDYLKPNLTHHGIEYDTVNELEMLRSVPDWSKYEAVISVGGDGTASEILRIVKSTNVKLGFMPAGSGNGIVKSLLHTNGHPFSASNAASIISNGGTRKLDIIDVDCEKDNKIWPSFLAISWAFVSDLDIGTEWLRFLGSFRFILGALYAILRKRSYHGRLTYWDSEGSETVIEGDFVFFWACNVSHASSDTHSAPGAKVDDGLIHISYLRAPVSRYTLLKIALGLDSGSFTKMLDYVSVKKFKLEPTGGIVAIDGECVERQTIVAEPRGDSIDVLG